MKAVVVYASAQGRDMHIVTEPKEIAEFRGLIKPRDPGDFLSFYLGSYFTKYLPFDLNFSPTYFAGILKPQKLIISNRS